MKDAVKFLAINSSGLPWEDGVKVLGLPPGVQVKIIAEAQDNISQRVDKFVKFPPGYIEPRHTHDYCHVTLVIEGEMHVDGKVLKPSDYLYGGAGEPHGPLHYPKGCTVFGASRGVKLTSAQKLDQTHQY